MIWLEVVEKAQTLSMKNGDFSLSTHTDLCVEKAKHFVAGIFSALPDILNQRPRGHFGPFLRVSGTL